MASTTSVLPAPVSPVTAVMPGPSTSVSSPMTPRSVTASSISISARPIGSVIGRSGRTWPSGCGGSRAGRTITSRAGATDAGAHDGVARRQLAEHAAVDGQRGGPVAARR